MRVKITIEAWWLPGFTTAAMAAAIIHPVLGLLVVCISSLVVANAMIREGER